MNHDVFISFSFIDKTIVDKISNQLNFVYNIPCWICTADIRGGDDFYDDIVEAIEVSKLLLLVQTQSSVKSDEVQDEVMCALNSKKIVVPFIIDDSELKGKLKLKLSSTQRVDGRADPLDDRIKELAQELCKILDRPFCENCSSSRNESENRLSSTLIDFDKDDIFVGRESLMEEIHSAFEKHRTVCLQGLGGIGKTELAKQYYDRNKKTETEGCYSKVVFARYDGSFASLIADDVVFNIKGVTRMMVNNDGKDVQQSDEDYALTKINELKRTCDSETLIIIDNFDTDDEAERGLLAKLTDQAPYKVLITTRNVQPEYKTVLVKELDHSFLTDLFIKYYGEENCKFSKDDPSFRELFRIVGDHTLTVEIIAKYLNHIDCVDSVSEMVDILKEEGFSVFDEDEQQKNPYKRLKDVLLKSKLNDSEINFLKCLALMPSVGVKFNGFFGTWLGGKLRVWNSIMNKLVARGFVKYDTSAGIVYLHPVIRETVISDLRPDYGSCKEFVDACAHVHEDYFPSVSWNWDYETKTIYLDCFKSITELCPLDGEDIYRVYYNISLLYNYIGGCSETIHFHEKMYEFAKSFYGEDHLETALSLHKISWKYSNARMFEEALPTAVKAADWFVEHEGGLPRQYRSAVQGLIDIYYFLYSKSHDRYYYDKAFEYFEKYEIYMEKMRKISPQLDLISRSYTKFYLESGDYESAEKMLERFKDEIYAVAKETGTSSELDMSSWYDHMSRLCFLKGEYKESLENLDCAYKGYIKYFNLKNPRVLNILERIVNCHIKLGNSENAAVYLSIARDTAKEIYTPEHPVFARYDGLEKNIKELL